jgi:uncharacterized protein
MVQETTITSGNQLYPVFLKLDRLKILLVGGGNVAAEKLQSLLSNCAEAHITVVAPFFRQNTLEKIEAHPNCHAIHRSFDPADLDNIDLLIGATDDPALHLSIKTLASEKGVLVNIADTPALCDFYLGSIVQKGHLKIAISTNGKSPTAAKRIKELLNDALPEEIDELLNNLSAIRGKMTGDFSAKVERMNAITRPMVETEHPHKAKQWRRIASYSTIAFILMLLGHFIFSYLPLEAMSTSIGHWYDKMDKGFPLMILAGFLAQLVDGALGMGFGVTSATVLLSAGVNPASISGSIHTAEMFASGVSGYSHYKFGNVDKRMFRRLVIPGVLGAIGGALMLVFMGDKYGGYIRPVIAVYTLFLGIKFIIGAFRKQEAHKPVKRFGLLAAVGGFFDSFGGGGWGPIVTTTLVNSGQNHRYVVGTVSLTEFFVTLASAFTFFQLLGMQYWQTILGLIIGGSLAAPIAARLAGKLPRKTAFLLLGILVIFWSIRILIKLF